MRRLLLAGDIGGTKTNLALYTEEGGCRSLVREATLRSADYGSVSELLAGFLDSKGFGVDVACFGAAGPLRGGRIVAPNLRWAVDVKEIAACLGTPRVALVNDLLATALGIQGLPPESLACLQEGHPDPEGNGAVIAAGTGLGQALLFRSGDRFVPAPSEGGHSGFAPSSDLEIDLLRFLSAELGQVSAEEVVSGPGLLRVYRFFTATGRELESRRVRERLAAEDASAVVSEEGMAGTDAACARALDLWARAYGAEARNLALKALATAGVYVGGGIAPKILPKLLEGPFLEAFRGQGHVAELLSRIPVRVLLDPKTALYGAAALVTGADERPGTP